MNASDIMTRAVVTIPPNAPIAEAVRLMLGQRISGLPVVDAEGRLVGILTEGDLLRRAELGTEKTGSAWQNFLRGPAALAKDYVQSHARKVEDLMTAEVVGATETTPLTDVVALMQRRHIRRVPILADGRLVGMVSRADLLRALSTELERAASPAPSDMALRKLIEAEFRGQPWFRSNRVHAVVADGAIYLEGLVFDEHEHEAIRVAAENIEGVKAVLDHIEYVNPNLALSYGV